MSEPITERPDSIALDGVPNVALAVGLSESEYRQVIAGFVDVFKPIAGSQGYELEIIADWNDDQDNAHARTQFDVLTNKVYQIWLPGGTARAVPSADALSAILCHEFGHYAGGFPIMSPALSPTEQLAGEGSSDYYSAFCLRTLWEDDEDINAGFRDHPNLTPDRVAQCEQVWGSEDERDICYRVLATAVDLTRAYHASAEASGSNDGIENACWFWGELQPPRLDTPFPRVVARQARLHAYPAPAQCRLDVIAAGALCNGRFDPEVIPGGYLDMDSPPTGPMDPRRVEHAENYFCARSKGFELGVRPLCWYSPPTELPDDRMDALCEEYGMGTSYDPVQGKCVVTRDFCEQRTCFYQVGSEGNWFGDCDLTITHEGARWTKNE
ncbi:MAG: hypothetical protein MJE77_14040 [Proteobacteria bacterium]|nr:hypothetical protein [Pseudomonadota bacterium]